MSDFDAWIAKRHAAERGRIHLLRFYASRDDLDIDGVVALIKESSDELERAIAAGLVAQCRLCSGRGTRERAELEGSTSLLTAPGSVPPLAAIRHVTVACPACGGLGLVRGCSCAHPEKAEPA